MKKALVLIILAFGIRLLLHPFFTYQLDHHTFIAWGRMLRDGGISAFYGSGWSDYLPGYLYVLKLLAHLENWELVGNTLLYKLPAILIDLATGFLIYLAVRDKANENNALFAAFIFLFNPAVFANSTLWGQVDIFTSLFSIASIYFLQANLFISATSLALGGLVKPQIAMTLPVIFALMLNYKWSFRKIASYFLTSVAFFVIIFLPFSNQVNILQFIYDRVMVTLNQYKYGSVNAFNFWGLFGFWKSDTIGIFPIKNIAAAVMFFSSFFIFLKTREKRSREYFSLALLFMINFFFMTRMHERHMLPIFAPLAIAASTNLALMPIYVGLSITYLANLYYAYTWIDQNHTAFFPDNLVTGIIVANLVMFGVAIYIYLSKTKINLNIAKLFKKENEIKFKDYLSPKLSQNLLYIIIIFALLTRIINLWIPEKDYFDEIYHAFSARTLAEGDNGLWDWMVQNPEGFAYEWTHPPLNKEIMATFMYFFGTNSFVWRFPGALLGVGIVYLTYKIAWQFTKSRDIAILASLLTALDGLVFTMSRIGTADVYLVFFILLTLYFYMKDKYFLASIALGLAAATKWSTLWFLPILVVAHLAQRKKIFDLRIAYFFTIPVLIYLASYIPMFLAGHDLVHFWGMQKQMWWYHSGLEATHPYESKWWTWPIMSRPVYLYQLDNNDGLLGNIYAMGNPMVFWFGLVSVFLSFYYLIKRQAPKLIGVVLFAYLAFFVPWAASPRIMFIYHYLPSVPFMAILAGFVMKKNSWLVLPVCSVAAILFIYFYPQWTGIPVPEDFSSSYYWFKSWR